MTEITAQHADTDLTETRLRLLEMTSDIVAAHLGNNEMPAEDVPAFIAKVLAGLEDGLGAAPEIADEAPPEPAVPIDQSIQPDYLVCLEDGVQKKMLKRYLQTRYDMTPDDYRARWGLPADYPMVAPNHSKRRSALARESGLGTKRGKRVSLS